MVRFYVRVLAVVLVASLPYPIYAQAPPAPPAPPTLPTATRQIVKSALEAAHAATWSAMSWRDSWQAKQGPESTDRVERSFKLGANGTVDISNISGEIVVNAGGSDTVVVQAVKRYRGGASESKDQLSRTQVSMVERGGRLEVKTVYPGQTRHWRTSVDYTITAPAGTSVYAHSISGEIKVSNVRGEVRCDTVSGDVVATNTPGATLVKSVSGDSTVSGVSNQNELRVTSISGEVTVNGAKVRAIDADSISGGVKLTDVTCERATAKSISGDIHFVATLAKSGRYEFKSQSGDIRLTLAGSPGFEVDASSFSGNVRSDLPLTLRAGDSIGGRGPGRKIHGVHGDGSAQLVLVSFSGDITIAAKK